MKKKRHFQASTRISHRVMLSDESLDERSSNVRREFYDQFRPANDGGGDSIYVREVFDSYVIVDAGTDGMFKVNYKVADSAIEFEPRDKWTKVEIQYTPVTGSIDTTLKVKASAFKSAQQADEGSQPKGTSWNVTIIAAGETKTNPPVWVTPEALEASKSIFNGAKVYAVNEGDKNGHKSDANKKVIREVVGVLENAYVDGNELKATLNILPSEKWLRDNLLFLDSKKQLHVYQLSVDSIIATEKKNVPELGREAMVMKKIFRADLDIVSEAAAGGKFNKLVASKQSSTGDFTMLKNKLMTLFLLVYPQFLASKNVDPVKVDENELFTHLLAADKAQPRLKLPDGMQLDTDGEKVLDQKIAEFRASIERGGDPPADPSKADSAKSGAPADNKKDQGDPAKLQASLDALGNEMKELKLQACAGILTQQLAESNLPKHLQASIEKRWKGKLFTSAELADDIKTIREMIAPFTQPGVNNHGMDVHGGADERDKFQAALDGLFLCSSQGLNPLKAGTDEYKKLLAGQDPFRSIKEAYVAFTGDVNVTGQIPRSSRFSASLMTSDWTNVLLDALNKRLARDYPQLGLDTWRAFVEVRGGVTDFKEQKTVRFGGYPNLSIVGERDPYPALASPSDEKVAWSPAKRGGTEDLTREMIKNDDVNSLQKIPTRMARAAGQTLHEFVYDFIRPGVNPTIYDLVALYHSDHSNIGSAALASDGVALAAARLRMKKQVMPGNSKRLGIRAGFVAVPSDLEQVSYGLLTPAYNKSNQVPEFLQQVGVTPIVVDYWDDATDWVLIARREDIMGMELGFVDGQETPQIFVSDLPNAGSFFTNDVITYKIRHEYGGAINDFRAFDGSIVAG